MLFIFPKRVYLLVLAVLCNAGAFAQAGLTKMTWQGSNPGKLDAFVYKPANVDSTNAMPLVVVLHGCSQSAASLADLSGWNTLAARYGFMVLYPQQRLLNNVSTCFNWFNKWDSWRDEGEVLSIRQMTEHIIATHNIDRNRVFIYGVSAGGAMSVAAMACYPTLFNAGAVLAGAPYGVAKDAFAGLSAMASPVYKTQAEWVQLVRAQNKDYSGQYPRLIAVHGTQDAVVDLQNSKQLLLQWTGLFNTDAAADAETKAFAGNTDITRFQYHDKDGTVVAIYYEARGLGHAIMVDPGNGSSQGGKVGAFCVDKDFFSTYWIAVEFGLIETDTSALKQ